MAWSCRTVTQVETILMDPMNISPPDEKATVGKKAAEIGVAATVKSFSKQFHGHVLKENSVRMWRDKYLKKLE